MSVNTCDYCDKVAQDVIGIPHDDGGIVTYHFCSIHQAQHKKRFEYEIEWRKKFTIEPSDKSCEWCFSKASKVVKRGDTSYHCCDYHKMKALQTLRLLNGVGQMM